MTTYSVLRKARGARDEVDKSRGRINERDCNTKKARVSTDCPREQDWHSGAGELMLCPRKVVTDGCARGVHGHIATAWLGG